MTDHSRITELWDKSFQEKTLLEILAISPSGSDRRYYRLQTAEVSYIAACSDDITENQSFLHYTELMLKKGIRVPQVLAIAEDEKCYIQDDLGDTSLLDKKNSEEDAMTMYSLCIHELVKVQSSMSDEMKEEFIANKNQFGEEILLHDLMYFLYDFVKIAGIEFNPQKTLEGLVNWVQRLSKFNLYGFMYRDFQARNVMVYKEETYLIDYQGAMWGPCTYDMSSLLFQARAGLSAEEREKLWSQYKTSIRQKYNNVEEEDLNQDFQSTTFLRLIQVLGAYGFRGLIQKKDHFEKSISAGLKNLRDFMADNPDFYIPEGFKEIIQEVTQEDFINKF